MFCLLLCSPVFHFFLSPSTIHPSIQSSFKSCTFPNIPQLSIHPFICDKHYLCVFAVDACIQPEQTEAGPESSRLWPRMQTRRETCQNPPQASRRQVRVDCLYIPTEKQVSMPVLVCVISFSSAFSLYICEVHHFWWDFLHLWPLFLLSQRGSHIPSLWIVSAGCILLVAFTCLVLGCQDLLSPCDGMHVCPG